MNIKKNFYPFLVSLFCITFLLSSCGSKDEDGTAAGDEAADEGISLYYRITAEGMDGRMKISRIGDDKFYWERTLTADDLDMKIVLISDGKDVYVMAEENGEKVAYKSSMEDYNKSVDKAQQICVINPGRTMGNFEKVGEKTIIGNSCSVYLLPDGTQFTVSDDGKDVYEIIAEGIEVKFTNNQTKPGPSETLFEIPSEVEFIETDDIIGKF